MTDTPRTGPEVPLTSGRSGAAAKGVGAVTALSVAGLVVYGVVVSGSWWLSVIIGVCGAVAVLVVAGMTVAITQDAEKTAALEAAGTRVEADVVAAERVEGADEVVYEIVLRIPVPDGVTFGVEHRCTHYACAAATRRSATTRPVIVDPTTRAWAVIH
ncbi:hypothetical protein IOD16_16235 [Saccharothrix sp. 6-C]|uniref:hypothetical protein n=1 Tax=Saccharothrix sp. 6-C TaxID=2781735 RepID=UPI001916D760|nr:hypothetical protein [Saccharothrix sp. 6-C]QQQ79801.1 hypothetical protein IOD16_16235 [Saccharothrix sp. 6-C]